MKSYLNYEEASTMLSDIDVDAPEKSVIIARSELSDEIGVIFKGKEVMRLTKNGYIVYDDEFAKDTPCYQDGQPKGEFIMDTTDSYGKKCKVVFNSEPSWEERVNICLKS